MFCKENVNKFSRGDGLQVFFAVLSKKNAGNVCGFKNSCTFAAVIKKRDVAQLVARHVRDVEVGSSSLLIPTTDEVNQIMVYLFFCLFGSVF